MIREEYIDEASEMTESTELDGLIGSLPMQAKAVLTGVYKAVLGRNGTEITSTELYESYTKVAAEMGLKVMTDRRIRDYMWELEGSGLIISRLSSAGRHVREKKIKLGIPKNIMEPMIKKIWEMDKA
jgi:Cdc6-like AAA superfamily ATPase